MSKPWTECTVDEVFAGMTKVMDLMRAASPVDVFGFPKSEAERLIDLLYLDPYENARQRFNLRHAGRIDLP